MGCNPVYVDRRLVEARKLAVSKVKVLLVTLSDVLPAAKTAKIDGAPGHAVNDWTPLEFDPAFRAGSYAELLLSLDRLRDGDRHTHRAVWLRYVAARRRVLELTVRRHRWGGTIDCPVGVEVMAGSGVANFAGRHATVLCRTWDPGVDEAAAAAGVEWLTDDMHGGRWHEIDVPGEMLELVA